MSEISDLSGAAALNGHAGLPFGLDPFRAWGIAGLAAAAAVSIGLAAADGLSVTAQLLLLLIGVTVFLLVTSLTEWVSGAQSLTYYHHEIAILAAVAATAAGIGQPVPAHLGVSALGLGTFLVFGRIGCLSIGCCHGRPGRRVPVQALESGIALAIVVVGVVMVLDRHRAGIVWEWYVGAYAVARFVLEELRGDHHRRWWRGLSEAQWTSIALVVLSAIAAAVGLVPRAWPPFAAAGALAAAAISVAVVRRRGDDGVFEPRHLAELSRACRAGAGVTGVRPLVHVTSCGVQVSTGRAGAVDFVTLSGVDVPTARGLAAICLPPGPAQVIRGPGGAVHVLAVRAGIERTRIV